MRVLLSATVVAGLVSPVSPLAQAVSDEAGSVEVGDMSGADSSPAGNVELPTDAVAGAALARELAVLSETMIRHRNEGRTDEALQTAREIAATVEEQYGASKRLIEPLTNVADLEIAVGNAVAAEQVIGRLIPLIETQDSVFSTDLVEPLTWLAALYSASDRRVEATTLLRRARHITHRTLGILNLEQLEIADQLADNYFRLGKIGEGSRENRFAYRVNEREYGADSPELVPALNKLAAWYERIGEFSLARQYYKKSIQLIEKDYGMDDLRLVDSLQRVANTYSKQRIYKSEGQSSLMRAIAIHESHPESDEIAYAQSLIELGDWMMATLRTRDAMTVYSRAWNLLTANGTNPDRGAVFFGKPKRLRYDPPVPTASRMMSRPEIHVDVEFLVTTEGSVKDIEITDSTADWRTQSDVRGAMRHARFRPKFSEDGQPVPVRISQRWTYVVPKHLRRSNATKDSDVEKVDAGDPDSG